MFRYVNECLSAAKLYRSYPETLAGLLQAHVSQVSGWWKCYHDMTSIVFSSCLLKCLQKITEINRQLELAKKGQSCCQTNDSVKIRMAGTRGVWYSIVILTMWKLTLLGMTLILQKKINKTQNIYGAKIPLYVFLSFISISHERACCFPQISAWLKMYCFYTSSSINSCVVSQTEMLFSKPPSDVRSWVNDSVIHS